MTSLSLRITKKVSYAWKSFRKSYTSVIVLFCLFTLGIYSILHLTLLTGWHIDSGQYKLVIRTKGQVKNLTITEHIYSFNASTATYEHPHGVRVETISYPGEKDSWVKVHIENLKDKERAILTFQNIRPTENISIDAYKKFSQSHPDIQGELHNCTHIFSHFSVQANSPLGKITVYSDSIIGRTNESGGVQWNLWGQSKTKTLTVSMWGMLFLSATLSSLIISISSFVLKKPLDIFPTVTLIFVTLVFFVYVFIGVGDDFLSIGNLGDSARICLLIFSPIFHADYVHLMGNMMLVYCLLEVYLKWRAPMLRGKN